jgi:3'(2'), 5'-bisphosphate nucleotidase
MDDHQLAAWLARRAGELLVPLRDGPLDGAAIGFVGDQTANAFLMSSLKMLRPGDAILSEESPDDLARLAAQPGVDHRPAGRHPRISGATQRLGRPRRAGGRRRPRRGRGRAARHRPHLRHRRRAAGAPQRAPADHAGQPHAPAEGSENLADALGAELRRWDRPVPRPQPSSPGRRTSISTVGGQHEWDNCAPVAVALAAGLIACRIDGSPIRYNQADVKVPDLLIAEPSTAGGAGVHRPPAATRPRLGAAGIRISPVHFRLGQACPRRNFAARGRGIHGDQAFAGGRAGLAMAALLPQGRERACGRGRSAGDPPVDRRLFGQLPLSLQHRPRRPPLRRAQRPQPGGARPYASRRTFAAAGKGAAPQASALAAKAGSAPGCSTAGRSGRSPARLPSCRRPIRAAVPPLKAIARSSGRYARQGSRGRSPPPAGCPRRGCPGAAPPRPCPTARRRAPAAAPADRHRRAAASGSSITVSISRQNWLRGWA